VESHWKGSDGCLTFKQRADLPPACDPSLAGELTQRDLQEKHGNTAGEEEDQVGDEERTWKRMTTLIMRRMSTVWDSRGKTCDYCSRKKHCVIFFSILGHYVGLSFKFVGSFVLFNPTIWSQSVHALFFSGETSENLKASRNVSKGPNVSVWTHTTSWSNNSCDLSPSELVTLWSAQLSDQ